jgi:hypothetical protein
MCGVLLFVSWPSATASAAGTRSHSRGSFTALAYNILLVEFGPEQRDPAQFRIAPQEHPAGRRLGLIHDQFAVFDVVAERHVPAHRQLRMLGAVMFAPSRHYRSVRPTGRTPQLDATRRRLGRDGSSSPEMEQQKTGIASCWLTDNIFVRSSSLIPGTETTNQR